MSKSNTLEIIAVLWLIAAILSTGWIAVGFTLIFIENLIEGCIWAYMESIARKDINHMEE